MVFVISYPSISDIFAAIIFLDNPDFFMPSESFFFSLCAIWNESGLSVFSCTSINNIAIFFINHRGNLSNIHMPTFSVILIFPPFCLTAPASVLLVFASLPALPFFVLFFRALSAAPPRPLINNSRPYQPKAAKSPHPRSPRKTPPHRQGEIYDFPCSPLSSYLIATLKFPCRAVRSSCRQSSLLKGGIVSRHLKGAPSDWRQ